jgi:hypothetical protein
MTGMRRCIRRAARRRSDCSESVRRWLRSAGRSALAKLRRFVLPNGGVMAAVWLSTYITPDSSGTSLLVAGVECDIIFNSRYIYSVDFKSCILSIKSTDKVLLISLLTARRILNDPCRWRPGWADCHQLKVEARCAPFARGARWSARCREKG